MSEEEKSTYDERGVSSKKEDVHNAITNVSKGIYSNTFCKIVEDSRDDPDFCEILHADGNGTKVILAYIYWKITGDMRVWKWAVQDAMVMNTDDVICAGGGLHGEKMRYVSIVNRNKHLIPAEVIAAIINGTEELYQEFQKLGINISGAGGETADLGDSVRTLTIDGVLTTSMQREHVQRMSFRPGQVIVGLASYGQATYEDRYNSGMGSNGLTSARHDIFYKKIAEQFPEAYDPNTNFDVIYAGKFSPIDPIEYGTRGEFMSMAEFVLSPTRSYAPILKKVFENDTLRKGIEAIVHCSGGGQTKVTHYMPDNVAIVKDNLFPIQLLFQILQQETKTEWKEMYQVYNMGHRMEIYCDSEIAKDIIEISSKQFNVDAQIVGYCEERSNDDDPKLTIKTKHGTFTY